MNKVQMPHAKKYRTEAVLEHRGFKRRLIPINKKYEYVPATFNPFADLARRKKN